MTGSSELQVIGAGFGRTGTLSLKTALEHLGFGPSYHMYEMIGHVEHARAWVAANKGDTDALRVPLEGYRSSVDWPGCVFWDELARLHPEAKVVLSVRPPERWYASFCETVGAVIARERPADLPEVFAPVFDVSEQIVRDRSFGPAFDLADAERVIAAYEAHNAAVRAGVDPDRFLEFDVTEGWEPLCVFLGVDVPDEEFPNVNDREQFRMLFGLDAAADADAPTPEDLEDVEHRFRVAAATTEARS